MTSRHYATVLITLTVLLCTTNGVVKLRRQDTLGKTKLIKEAKFSNISVPSSNGTARNSYMGVSLLLVGDYALYRNFVDIAGDEDGGLRYATEYLTAIFEQVRAIYDDMEFSFGKLHLQLAGTFVAIRPADCPLLQPDDQAPIEMDGNITLEDLDGDDEGSLLQQYKGPEALSKIFGWKKRHEDLLPVHDHTMLLTKLDLLSWSGSDSSQGMAPLAALCKGGESSSVVEDVGAMATAIIAAHELGHNLGASHDHPNLTEECHQHHTFLMAPSVSVKVDDERFFNVRRLSPCSRSDVEEYLSRPEAFCVRKKSRRRVSAPNPLTDSFPGERWSASLQCQLAFGKGYGLCTKPEYKDLGGDPCRRVWCKDRQQDWDGPCETLPFFPALDGTQCGMNRWCQKGHCIDNAKKMLACKDLNADLCRKYSKSKLRHYCNAKDFSEICCLTCHKAKKEISLERLR